jgi:hypothetical protein
MTVDERVVAFLRQNTRKGFCDACIARHVQRPSGGNINRFQAGNATRPLKPSSDFEQGPGLCSNCGNNFAKITMAV